MRKLFGLLLLSLVVMVSAPAAGNTAVDPPEYQTVLSDLGYSPDYVAPDVATPFITVSSTVVKQEVIVEDVETLARDVGFSWQGLTSNNRITLTIETAAESHQARVYSDTRALPLKQERCLLQLRC